MRSQRKAGQANWDQAGKWPSAFQGGPNMGRIFMGSLPTRARDQSTGLGRGYPSFKIGQLWSLPSTAGSDFQKKTCLGPGDGHSSQDGRGGAFLGHGFSCGSNKAATTRVVLQGAGRLTHTYTESHGHAWTQQ